MQESEATQILRDHILHRAHIIRPMIALANGKLTVEQWILNDVAEAGNHAARAKRGKKCFFIRLFFIVVNHV
jgi:hypothetical protein